MSINDNFFYGQPLAYGIQGFVIINPGETVLGPFFVVGPLDKPVIIQDALSNWGGNLNNQTIRVSVFGYFESITVDAASPGSLLAYRTN
jgi:hypothetical protein